MPDLKLSLAFLLYELELLYTMININIRIVEPIFKQCNFRICLSIYEHQFY